MSVQATTWVWNHSESTGNARLVLLAIADAADQYGDNSWPAQAKIASMARVSVRTVRRLVSDLVALGELQVDEFAGGTLRTRDNRRPHLYRLPMVPGSDGRTRMSAQPPVGGHWQDLDRTKAGSRADTGVPRTPSLNTQLQNPSGGSASPEQPGPQAQEDPMTTATDPAQFGLFDAPPEPPPPAQEPTAATVVAAYVDSYRRHHSGGDPVKRDIGRIARDAKSLLSGGRASAAELVAAATAMGAGPYSNLGVSLNIERDHGRRPGTRSKGIAPPAHRDDPAWQGAEEENAARAAQILAEDPELAAWYAGGEFPSGPRQAGDAA